MLVSCTVVNKRSHKTLLKWKIIKCETESIVEQFFTVVCRIHLETDPNSLVLEAAFIGKSKETLDPTAFDIDLGEVVRIFGSFLKYEVSTDERPSTTTVSAFTVSVFVRQLNCHEPIEPLYYSTKYEPICVYCANPQPFTDEKQYPLCAECMIDKPPVLKK